MEPLQAPQPTYPIAIDPASANESEEIAIIADAIFDSLSFLSKASSREEYLQFMKNASPGIYPDYKNCHIALRLSQDRNSPLMERNQYTPISTGNDTASGSYFLKDNNGKIVLVGKPTCQEAPETYKYGIEPGGSAIRERLAWKVQQILDYDFGIPPTSLWLMNHEKFQKKEACIVTNTLNKMQKFALDLTEEKFTEEASQCDNVGQLIEKLLQTKRKVFIDALVRHGLKEKDISGLVKLIETNPFVENLDQLIDNEFKGQQ